MAREHTFIAWAMRQIRKQEREERRKNAVRLTGDEWRRIRIRILKRDSLTCTYCGATARLECDHIVPLALGGSNEDSNLTTACYACNRSKSAKLAADWRQERCLQ